MSAFLNLQNLVSQLSGSTGPNGSGSPTVINRYAGGHSRLNQPYISGYWYLIMQPPVALLGTSHINAATWLHATAESFTPPTKTVTKADVPAMGGVASSFVAGQELSRTFTVAFREWQGLPIMNTMQAWTNAIDARSGVSPLLNFNPSEYKGAAYVALCKPTITRAGAGTTPGLITRNDIEQLFYFEGVFPETLPYDSLTSDIATNDSAQLSVTFSFDGWPATADNVLVLEKFESLAKTNQINDATITSHLGTPAGITNTVFGGANNV